MPSAFESFTKKLALSLTKEKQKTLKKVLENFDNLKLERLYTV